MRRALLGALVLVLSGCSQEKLGPEAEHGRQVYVSNCTACHATNPSDTGPVGPPVKGASRELLEARLLRGEYPAGYTPKRSTRVMPPQPQVAGDIGALAEYLK